MPTIPRFDPPAHVNDFDDIANQKNAWSEFLSHAFNENIKFVETRVGAGKSQFYNPMLTHTTQPSATRDIVWRGFPLLLFEKHAGNREAAFREADQLPPRPVTRQRPQDEYLEWFVSRNTAGKITRVTFTCEGPEYWEALAHGYPADYEGPRTAGGTGSLDKVLALYRQHISPAVQRADLLDPTGRYNRLNKWNTTHGAMHLNQRNNTLQAEINIAAFATVLRKRGGQILTDANDLIACGRYGEPGRASDPRIGAAVNSLARDGFSLTLANPVGLYIGGLNADVWTTPNNKPASTFWKVVRGSNAQGLRAVYEVPSQEGYTVGDIKIGGVPIQFGGQLAEFIDIKLTAVACREGQR